MRALEQVKPAEQSAPRGSQTGFHAELGSIWGMPPIPKQVQDFASGVGEGLAGACKEGVQTVAQAVTHPGETIHNAVKETGNALKTGCEATVSAAHYVGDKVSHGDINGVAHDAQQTGQAIGHVVAEGVNHVSHMNAHDLGKFVGHDVLPGVVASVVAPELAGEGLALAAGAMSKLGTLAKEEAALSRVVSVCENAKSKIDAISEKMAGLNQKMESLQQRLNTEIKESFSVGTRDRTGDIALDQLRSEKFLHQVRATEKILPPLESSMLAKTEAKGLIPVHNMGEALLPRLTEKYGVEVGTELAKKKAFAEGTWILEEKNIRIAEFTGLGKDLVPNKEVPLAIFHEIGHMIDDVTLGHTPLSQRIEFATAFRADKTANPEGIKKIWQLLGNDLDGTQKVGEVWAYQHANVVSDALGLPASTSPLPKAVREGCPQVYEHIKDMREILAPKPEIIEP